MAPGPSAGEPAGRLGLGLRAEDSGRGGHQKPISGSGPGRGRERREDAGEQAGQPSGPPWLSPAGPLPGEKGLRWGEGVAEPAFGQGVEWARDPGDVVCLLEKNAGAGAPARVAGRLKPGRGHESGPSQAGQMAGQLLTVGWGVSPEDRLGAWAPSSLVFPAGPEMSTKVQFRFLENTRCDLGSAKIS